MSVYWKWVCPGAGSALDPHSFDENFKYPPLCKKTSIAVALLMMDGGSWAGKGVFLFDDRGDDYDGPGIDVRWENAYEEARMLITKEEIHLGYGAMVRR